MSLNEKCVSFVEIGKEKIVPDEMFPSSHCIMQTLFHTYSVVFALKDSCICAFSLFLLPERYKIVFV